MWAGRDLNPHELPHSVLNAARLPFRHLPIAVVSYYLMILPTEAILVLDGFDNVKI